MVKTTNDGGALILSTIYDWTNNPEKLNYLHLLKIDSLGNYQKGDPNEHIPPLSVYSQNETRPFNVFPNPATNHFSVNNTENSNKTLSLYSSNGTHLTDINVTPGVSTINISQYPSGIYLLLFPYGQANTLSISR